MLQVTFLARSGIQFWKSFFFILIHIQDCLFLNYVFCPCKSSKSKYSTYDHYKSTLSYCTKSLTICTCIKKSSPHYQEKWSSTLSRRMHLHWHCLKEAKRFLAVRCAIVLLLSSSRFYPKSSSNGVQCCNEDNKKCWVISDEWRPVLLAHDMANSKRSA